MGAFTATTAVIIQSLVAIDADVGLRYAETAQLIESADLDPTRQEIEHTNHRDARVVWIGKSPKLDIDVKSKVTLLASGMNNSHPGKSFTLASFANWYTAINHGFAATGYWILTQPKYSPPKGDLANTSYKLTLFQTFTDGVNVVDTPV